MNIQGKNLSFSFDDDDKLGEGTFGITYKAKGSDGQTYAIKQYKGGIQAKAERDFEEKVLKDILQYICPNHTPCFVDSFQDNDIMYVAMDYLDAVPVSDIVDGPQYLSYRHLHGEKFVKDLVLGLSAIHSSGLIHQDIKGPNLMYDTSTNQVKYIDFGHSCLLNTGTNTQGLSVFGFKFLSNKGNYCGSPGTISTSPPEMVMYDGSEMLFQRGMGFNLPRPDNGIYTEKYLVAHDIWSIACQIMDWYDVDGMGSHLFRSYAADFVNLPHYFTQEKWDNFRNINENSYKIVAGLMSRDVDKRIDNFNDIVGWYNSWVQSLPEYPNEWNQYDITQQVKEQLYKFRCELKRAPEMRGYQWDTFGVDPRKCL